MNPDAATAAVVHHGQVETTRSRASGIAVGVIVAEACLLAIGYVLDARLVRMGYGDRFDSLTEPWMWLVGVAILSPALVGWMVLRSHPRHAVGWLFLALSASLMLTGVLETWFNHAVIVEPPEVGGAGAAAVLADKVCLPWWPLIAWILLLTPTGRFLSPRWARLGHVLVGATVVAFVLSLVSDAPLEDDYEAIGNPWAVEALSPYPRIGAWVAFAVLAVGLLLSAVSLMVRWRRSEGEERQRLLWLVLAVVPLPAVVPVHIYAVTTDNNAFVLITVALWLVLIPLVAGLSVLRYRLYDVDRIVATTTTYSLLSAVLVAIYAAIVWSGSHLSAMGSPSPAITATVGAVTAATLVAPLRVGIQHRVDRRFNRRAYDALRVVRDALAEPRAGLDPEALLRRALGDWRITVAYPGPDGWLDGAGETARAAEEYVEITRTDRVVARIGYDPALTERSTIAQVGRIAAAELDNTRLRAELERRLAEVAASRRRLSQAQREERRRIERDLHDGAQQTLLALAFELQAAQLNGEPTAMRDALAHGADAARDAAQELRNLANGLHPAALTDGGLAGVVDDLARRSPVPVEVGLDVTRLDAATEFTAWLVVAEAVTNAHKHARAQRIRVVGSRDDGHLRLSVRDDGRGGADPTGSGLRGLHDRVESAGGTLRVSTGADGTTVEVTLPCGS